VLYLPHTVIVRKPIATVDNEYVERGTAYHLPFALQVQLTPAKSAQAAFDASGVNIDSPQMMIWDVHLPHACPVGSVVEFDGHRYVVRTPTQTFAAHPVAASSSCYLEEMQFTPEGLDVLTPREVPSLIESGGASIIIGGNNAGLGSAMGGGGGTEIG